MTFLTCAATIFLLGYGCIMINVFAVYLHGGEGFFRSLAFAAWTPLVVLFYVIPTSFYSALREAVHILWLRAKH